MKDFLQPDDVAHSGSAFDSNPDPESSAKKVDEGVSSISQLLLFPSLFFNQFFVQANSSLANSRCLNALRCPIPLPTLIKADNSTMEAREFRILPQARRAHRQGMMQEGEVREDLGRKCEL